MLWERTLTVKHAHHRNIFLAHCFPSRRFRHRPWLRLSLCLASLLLLPGVSRAEKGEAVPGEVLVGLRFDARAREAAFPLLFVGESVGQQPALQVHRVALRPGVSVAEAVAFLRRQPGVRFAEPNYILRATATPNDSAFGNQWAVRKIQADRAWELWQPRSPVIIAIVDTGIDNTHPDLTNKIYRDALGIVGYDALADQRSDGLDGHGHGTHCAGIAAAQINNGTGIAGIAGWNSVAGLTDTTYTLLMPVKVLDAKGEGSDASVASGVTWAADHGAQVISMSLGGQDYSQTLDDAVQYAVGKGCLVVAAAGNKGTTDKFYPAADANVLAVAATNSSDTLASFSTYGDWVPVSAPGDSIFSTTPTYTVAWPKNYATASGTSMATPHIAGEAALLLAQNPGLSSRQVIDLILANVDPYTPYQSRTLAPGAGRINVYRALQAASLAATNPPLPPTGLTATGGKSQVILQWRASADATGYKVKRATSRNGPYRLIAAGDVGLRFVDAGVTNGVTYYYMVSALSTQGESANSNTASALPRLSISGVRPLPVGGGISGPPRPHGTR
jgi:thermitase